MRTIFKAIFIAFIIISLSSCYAMSDDGVMSSIDYNVVLSNGYPYYRDGRVVYYYYNSLYYYPYYNRDRRIVYYYYNRDYYYPHYYKGHRCFKKYFRPLPPPRRHRPPQRGFDRKPPKIHSFDGRFNNKYYRKRSFGNRDRR